MHSYCDSVMGYLADGVLLVIVAHVRSRDWFNCAGGVRRTDTLSAGVDAVLC